MSELYEQILGPLNQGNPSLTLQLAEQYLQQFPNDSDLWYIAGVAQKRMGEHNRCIQSFSKSLDANPRHWKALVELADLMLMHQHDEQAIGLFESALQHKPDELMSLNALGTLYSKRGDYARALPIAMRWLTLQPQDQEGWMQMKLLMDRVPDFQPSEEFIQLVYERAAGTNQSEVAFANIAWNLLARGRTDIAHALQQVTEQGPTALAPLTSLQELQDMLEDTLLSNLLVHALVCQMSFERFLCGVRYALAEAVFRLPDDALAASLSMAEPMARLARYFFRCEYLPDASAEEMQRVAEAEARLAAASATPLSPADQLRWLALALYKPLRQVPGAETLAARLSGQGDAGALSDVLDITCTALQREAETARHIEALRPVADDVSRKVQEQYEESPYPRWERLEPLPAMDSATYLQNILPYPVPYPIQLPDAPRILIAGCGTGRHTLMTSSLLPRASILNVDLSRASLAYALLKAKEYGKDSQNRFLQADILDLGALDERFDIVECSGVLHHMGDPMAGWHILSDRLKPGGLMKIGLYSRTARQDIIRTREEIARTGLTDSAEDMRRWRAAAVEQHHAFMHSPDFYTRSSLRDLIFHRQERQYTLPEIQQSVDALGLKFVGLLYDPVLFSLYQQHFPDSQDMTDLTRWQQLEEAIPSLFFRMYQFWCYKPA
jgi:SAM-dependent methyltransferase/Flp pilus assembly protein TadD